jgi:hypothetical protein
MVRMALVVFPSRMHNARVASAGALGGIGILLQEFSEFPNILSKPRIVGAAIAQGGAGAAKHMDVRERPWPRTFQSVRPNAAFAGKPAPTRIY